MEEGKDVWAIARVARNPFGLRERGGNILNEKGKVFRNDKELSKGFMEHNLRTKPREEEEEDEDEECKIGDEGARGDMIRRARSAIYCRYMRQRQ